MSRRAAFYLLVVLCLAIFIRLAPRTPKVVAWEHPEGQGQTSLPTDGILTGMNCEAWNDGVHGNELGCWDHAAQQRVLIKDIRPGRAGSDPYNFTLIGDNLYFLADDGRGIPEMWRTDGTESGTLRTRDLETGLVDGLLIF